MMRLVGGNEDEFCLRVLRARSRQIDFAFICFVYNLQSHNPLPPWDKIVKAVRHAGCVPPRPLSKSLVAHGDLSSLRPGVAGIPAAYSIRASLTAIRGAARNTPLGSLSNVTYCSRAPP